MKALLADGKTMLVRKRHAMRALKEVNIVDSVSTPDITFVKG